MEGPSDDSSALHVSGTNSEVRDVQQADEAGQDGGVVASVSVHLDDDVRAVVYRLLEAFDVRRAETFPLGSSMHDDGDIVGDEGLGDVGRAVG